MSDTVLITGATQGIGYELAKLWAKDGAALILVARNAARLAEIKAEFEDQFHNSVTVMALDLSRGDAALEVFTAFGAEPVDILVNNAGYGDFSAFAQSDWAKIENMMALNVVTLMHLTHLFMKGMIERDHGGILNVASVASFQPGPMMAAYYASKAAVLSFTEGIAAELQGTKVHVSALCPGPTKTGFEAKAALENSNLFKTLRVGSAEQVALDGYRALKKGKVVEISGLTNKAMIFMERFVPRRLVRWIIKEVEATRRESE